MRSVIKRRREAGNHRSEAFEIGSPPPLSGAGEDMSERLRRQPSASSRRSPSPFAFVAAVPALRCRLRAVTLATRYRRSRSASSLRLPLVDASEMSSSRRRTSAAPIPASWPATALQSPHGTPPRRSNMKKGRRCRLPSGYQTATLPSRERRFRECWNPTHAPLPSPGDRRSERTECGRLRPARRHHRAV